MPFDGFEHEHETEHEIFSLDALIDWLEQQPGGTVYDFKCVDGGCLIGRYAAARGLPLHTRPGTNFHDLHTWFYRKNLLSVACGRPHTYAAALERAKALRES